MLVLGISGSLRVGSYNTALLEAAAEMLPPTARLQLFGELGTLPPYSEDIDVEPAPPAVTVLRDAIANADALLLATPEYNASLPGPLKNALDWASRPYPENALRKVPAAVIGASTGPFGAVWAQAEARKVLSFAGAQVLEVELPIREAEGAFDERLRLVSPVHKSQLSAILADLIGAAVRSVAPREVTSAR